MKEHPGYFWPCLWLFFIGAQLPTWNQINRIEAALVRVAVALEAHK